MSDTDLNGIYTAKQSILSLRQGLRVVERLKHNRLIKAGRIGICGQCGRRTARVMTPLLSMSIAVTVHCGEV